MARVKKKTISRRTVEALRVEKDTVFWDRELTGFGVRVYPSGRKVYIAQARAKGKAAQRVTVAPHGVISPEEARRRAALIISRIKAGEEPVPEPLSATLAKGSTVADIARRYLEDHVAVRCRPRTAEFYRTAVDKYLIPRLGKLPALAVDHARVTELHHALRDKPVMANKVVETPVADLQRGRGQGADPGGEQSVRAGGQEPRAQARAVPDAGRVPAPRAGAEGSDGLQARVALLGGGDPAADPDRVPEARDPAPALGAGGSGGGRASAAGHQDGTAAGRALAEGGAGAGGHPASARQSLGDPGHGGGAADAQYRRSVGGGLRACRAHGYAHPRLPPQLCVPCAGARREPADDRAPARAFGGADDGALCASRSGSCASESSSRTLGNLPAKVSNWCRYWEITLCSP